MNELMIEQDVKAMDRELLEGLGLKMYVGLIDELHNEGLRKKFCTQYSQAEMMLVGAKILERLAYMLYEDENEEE